ncbi:MAG: class I SAM-dependent methyltransferase [Anaerolineales bacterium]|nr:class I SAM-dependent methyltransferase [Anaerolineales bacterium]
MDPALAERRYQQQAGWTAPLRGHLFARAGLARAGRVLEVGCGPGAVLRSLPDTRATVHGLDIDRPALLRAQAAAPDARLVCGDALRLPYADGAFDLCFFHYVLLWLPNPVQALREAARVTRADGAVLAFAEPDYTARAAPSGAWETLNRLQMEALRAQGADPSFGGRLAESFSTAGLPPAESGTLGADPAAGAHPLEAEVLAADLGGRLPAPELAELLAAAAGQFPPVPTYFTWARVPAPKGI